MKHKTIQVGTGGFGAGWCGQFLPLFQREGRVEVVAAVDTDPDALDNARNGLGLPPERCYTNLAQALDEREADFCTVVVPPAHHESVIQTAFDHGLHVLTEKPLAGTFEACVRVVDRAKAEGLKLGVTQSHRFDRDKTTLRRILAAGSYGPLDYLVSRVHVDCRRFAAWGKFRHEIADTLMLEDGVHQFDLLADLANARCETVYAEAWTAPWGEYAGEAEAFVTLRFSNGVRALYEGNMCAAVGLNPWHQQYLRAECRDATLSLSQGRLERFDYNPEVKRWNTAREGSGTEIALDEQAKWAHFWLIEQFLDWLDGGPPMATHGEANLETVAIVFAAMESIHTGQRVNVPEFLARASP